MSNRVWSQTNYPTKNTFIDIDTRSLDDSSLDPQRVRSWTVPSSLVRPVCESFDSTIDGDSEDPEWSSESADEWDSVEVNRLETIDSMGAADELEELRKDGSACVVSGQVPPVMHVPSENLMPALILGMQAVPMLHAQPVMSQPANANISARGTPVFMPGRCALPMSYVSQPTVANTPADQMDEIANFWLKRAENAKLAVESLRAQVECKISDSVVELPSAGSEGHAQGLCKPCAWFHSSKGCNNGSSCEFCHACGPREIKKRRRERARLLAAQIS